MTLIGENSFGGYPTTPGAFRTSYTGGGQELYVTTLDLLFDGVQLRGKSKPACLGPLAMNVTEMPAAGAQSFGFYCSGAPPLASGILVVGRPHIDGFLSPDLALAIRQASPAPTIVLNVQSDAKGYVETPFPLPAGTSGMRFAARYRFDNPTGCQQNGRRSTSNGLIVTIQ